MHKILIWFKNIFKINKIIKALDQAIEEAQILRNTLDNLYDELEYIKSLNTKYKEEIEQLRSNKSE